MILFQCSHTPIVKVNLDQSIPLETSPAQINSPSIVDVKDAFRFLIHNSVKSIHICGLYFTSNLNKSILKELKRAIERGVDVSFLFADSPFSRREFFNLDLSGYTNVKVQFSDIAGLGNSPYGQIHAKYAIFDGRYAMLGSANFSYPAFNDNIEINALIVETEIVRSLERIFTLDWNWALIKGSPVKSGITPDITDADLYQKAITLLEGAPFEINLEDVPDIDQAISSLFKKAKIQIDLELYTITSDKDHFSFYYDLIKEAAARGVKIKLLISQSTYDAVDDSGNIKYTYMHDAINDLLKLNIEIKKFNIWKMTGTQYSAVHSKLLIVDGRYVMLGSNNYSKGATYENREIAVMTSYTQIVFPLKRKFSSDWNSGYSELLDKN